MGGEFLPTDKDETTTMHQGGITRDEKAVRRTSYDDKGKFEYQDRLGDIFPRPMEIKDGVWIWDQ